MRFSLPILLAAAAAADAAAVQDDKRWCSTRGQACDTVKRVADAFAEALDQASSVTARAELGSHAAFMAKRQLDELALAVAASHPMPREYYDGLKLHYNRQVEPSTVNKRAAEANAEADAEAQGFPGQPCWKKRDAEAEHKWCLRFPGQPCWKRSADPAAEPEADPAMCLRFPGGSCWKREATPEAAEDQKRCAEEGGACWIAKRAAEAIVNTIEGELAYRKKRDADPALCLRYPGSPCWKRSADADPQGWCMSFPGQPCWKRDAAAAAAACNAPDGACTRATRDLHAMHNAARAILDNN
ncbi:hypothetical protein N656DRAFT_745700 [Canariomyces notabilis]|uniref:Clock-controlled pheromone ccg-4 n=1 Tax=Canariomyces notabilis TaxID=2074819 RepID=A0AAN6TLB5_9PEZI|nr:hypothetical protein N656DRAFT_745700 [Canariomyces arenarius]